MEALPYLGGIWQMRSMGCVVDDAVLLWFGHGEELIFTPNVKNQADAIVTERASSHDAWRAFHSAEIALHD